MSNSTSEKPNSHWHTERRDKMAAEWFRTLLLLNGGAAVALLAFLQAIWKEPSAIPLVPFVLKSLFIFAIGAAAAQCVETFVTFCALGLFVLGIVLVTYGACNNLPMSANHGAQQVIKHVSPVTPKPLQPK